MQSYLGSTRLRTPIRVVQERLHFLFCSSHFGQRSVTNLNQQSEGLWKIISPKVGTWVVTAMSLIITVTVTAFFPPRVHRRHLVAMEQREVIRYSDKKSCPWIKLQPRIAQWLPLSQTLNYILYLYSTSTQPDPSEGKE